MRGLTAGYQQRSISDDPAPFFTGRLYSLFRVDDAARGMIHTSQQDRGGSSIQLYGFRPYRTASAVIRLLGCVLSTAGAVKPEKQIRTGTVEYKFAALRSSADRYLGALPLLRVNTLRNLSEKVSCALSNALPS